MSVKVFPLQLSQVTVSLFMSHPRLIILHLAIQENPIQFDSFAKGFAEGRWDLGRVCTIGLPVGFAAFHVTRFFKEVGDEGVLERATAEIRMDIKYDAREKRADERAAAEKKGWTRVMPKCEDEPT